MGAFDEAIREHLELKRKQGTSEQDLEREEAEALGQGPTRPAPEPTEQPPAVDDVAESEDAGAPEPAETVEETPEASRAALAEPDELGIDTDDHPEAPPPAVDAAEELEPDEVLPDESLEPSSAGEDVLEETPEFLEETPEQDRLWFEQRAPKDFDFGD